MGPRARRLRRGARLRRPRRAWAGHGTRRFRRGPALVDRVHAHLKRSLRRSILVGFTHQATSRHAPPPPGPRPEFFFAPTEMTRRGHALGPAYAAAWTAFAPIATQTIQLTPVQSGERLPAIWRDLVAGRADPLPRSSCRSSRSPRGTRRGTSQSRAVEPVCSASGWAARRVQALPSAAAHEARGTKLRSMLDHVGLNALITTAAAISTSGRWQHWGSRC